MVKGDMNLRIIERGKPKDVIIKEGEVYETHFINNENMFLINII